MLFAAVSRIPSWDPATIPLDVVLGFVAIVVCTFTVVAIAIIVVTVAVAATLYSHHHIIVTCSTLSTRYNT